jgi:hypothetical protein
VIRVSRVSRVCVSFVCHGVSFIETQTAPPGGFESADSISERSKRRVGQKASRSREPPRVAES